MGKKVYIATRGNAEGIHRFRQLAVMLMARGHTITYDWTVDVEKARASGYATDQDVPLALRRQHAQQDAQGVLTAEVFVYLSPPPEERSEGAAYEAGLAHAKRDVLMEAWKEGLVTSMSIPVSIVVGTPMCLFLYRSDHFVETMSAAVDLIDSL